MKQAQEILESLNDLPHLRAALMALVLAGAKDILPVAGFLARLPPDWHTNAHECRWFLRRYCKHLYPLTQRAGREEDVIALLPHAHRILAAEKAKTQLDKELDNILVVKIVADKPTKAHREYLTRLFTVIEEAMRLTEWTVLSEEHSGKYRIVIESNVTKDGCAFQILEGSKMLPERLEREFDYVGWHPFLGDNYPQKDKLEEESLACFKEVAGIRVWDYCKNEDKDVLRLRQQTIANCIKAAMTEEENIVI